ncbi:MAG: ABC transporter permease [Limnochordaceae bacterium]|nr:ABC transporter permease [Limnochordaceae bacterium]
MGAVGVAVFVGMALFAPWLAPYDPNRIDLTRILQPPSAGHWLGTDQFGRDILSRIVWGARISLTVAVASLGLAAVAGILLGAVAGYRGGWIDEAVMRLTDVLLSFPDIMLAIAVTAVLPPGLPSVILAIGVYNLPQVTRVARGAVLSIRANLYVEAARAVGQRDGAIILRYVIPNALPPVVVLLTLRTAASILTAAGLSFLGMGIQPPTPEWGAMISEARVYLVTAPHLSLVPGMAIAGTVLAFNLLGDALNDALNPRARKALGRGR